MRALTQHHVEGLLGLDEVVALHDILVVQVPQNLCFSLDAQLCGGLQSCSGDDLDGDVPVVHFGYRGVDCEESVCIR